MYKKAEDVEAIFNVGDKVKIIGGNLHVGEYAYLERLHQDKQYWHVITANKQFCVDRDNLSFYLNADAAYHALINAIALLKEVCGIDDENNVYRKMFTYKPEDPMYRTLTTLGNWIHVRKTLDIYRKSAYTIKPITKTGNIQLDVLKQHYRVDTPEEAKALWYTFKEGTKEYYDLLKIMSLMENEKNLQKENNTMKLNLKNGVTVEGTPEEVMKIAKQLGVDLIAEGYYNSSTHGLIKISDMNMQHLQNAILKIYREWLSSLSTLTTPNFIKALQDGPTSVEFNNLLTEVIKRAK